MNSNNGEVYTSKSDNILKIVFYHPKKNSLPRKLLDKLSKAINNAGQDTSIQSIIISSEGTVFCAGASFDELTAIKNKEEGKAFFSGFAHLVHQIINCPKPVLCLVQGKAVGGALGLIAACDYVISSSDALFKLSELSIGIGPYVIAPVVISRIGKQQLKKISLENDWKTADWAIRAGLIDHIIPHKNLQEEGVKMAKKLCQYDQSVFKAFKTHLLDEKNLSLNQMLKNAELSGEMIISKYSQTVISQFLTSKK